MYWESFGFKEPPFALTPNPAFVFLSAPHQEAYAHLLFAIESRVGFIELSGEVGTGKTTIVRTLLNQLDPETYRTALIFNPTLSPLGLLREINSEFGLRCDSTDTRDLHQALNAYLLEENRAGRTVVLVIDEAQNLSVEVLEQVRLISNLETDSDKLIQIVLVGQPELNALLAKQELRQLDQRITVRYHLKPMCFEDTCAYVRHRIRFAAEGREPLLFSRGAFKALYRFSGGLPRLINGACDRALLAAYTRESREVSPEMAKAAITDLRKESSRRRNSVPMLALYAAMAVCVLVVGGFSLLSGSLLPDREQAQVLPLSPPSALTRDAALGAIASVPERENLHAALNAVLDAWQVRPVDPLPGQGADVAALARERGLVATRVPGNLDDLARLNAPALLHVSLPEQGRRLVALVAVAGDEVRVVPPIAGRDTLSRAELSLIWRDGATVLWKDFHGLASRAATEERLAAVKRLQGLLKQVGCYGGPLNGDAGPTTQAALLEFQQRERLEADGKVGPRTLMMLYRRAGGFFPPGLARDAGTGRPVGESGEPGNQVGRI